MAVILRNNYSICNPKILPETGAQPQHRTLAVSRQSRHRENDSCEADGPASVREVLVKRLDCALIRSCSYSLGITARKDMIQCTAKDLIGKYVGSTEDIVKEKLNEARGGVLLIDEVRMNV